MSEKRTFHNFRDAVKRIANEQNYDLTDPAMRAFCMGFVVGLIDQGKVDLLHDEYVRGKEAGEKVLARRDNFYAGLVKSPDLLLSTTDSVHIAGGVLPVVFGEKENQLWREIVIAAGEKKSIQFVHQDFSLQELELIGEFARFLQEKGKIPTCVDERLWYANGEYTKLVHCDCGACKGIGQVIGAKSSVEDMLHREFAPGSNKRPIQPGMSDHRSTTIYVDLGKDSRTLNREARLHARFEAGLPFHASFPIELLKAFIVLKRKSKEGFSDENQQILIQAWTKFNVGVPRAIIGGHNRDAHLADNTQIVLNTSGVAKSGLLNTVVEQIESVPHERVLRIA